ncbi:MAG TPA: hypothetical protein VJ852_09035 [Gemmatimonadaceae bacterium]|nr:hypothetical protein [Gemmatimonadaceae bacterium]
MASRSDSDAKYKAEIIETTRRQIARRIARFCTSLSAEQFELLLDKMVHIHWKYDVLPNIDPSLDADHKSTTQGFQAKELS